MARVYATSQDYQDHTGQTPPADIDRLLCRASELLDSRVLRHAVYDADPDTGLPTNPFLVEAVARATCAQVEWWEETGDELDAARRAGMARIGSVALGSTRGSGSGGSQGQGRQLADGVWEALRQPDLTRDVIRLGEVQHW